MEATCWSDYLCPWCYVGQQRSRAIEALGLPVEHRPFELHPEIGPEGRTIRADGRLAPTFARIAAECAELGVPFEPPRRMPNTNRALQTAELVRLHHRASFDVLHESLFAAQFATGDPLDDPDLLDELVGASGAPAAQVRGAIDDGEGARALAASMDAARAHGISGTPSWVLPGGLVIPGALETATVERWVRKIMARAT